MKFTEKQLKSYEAPLSDSEEQKCRNAIGMIRDALKILGYSEGNNSIKEEYSDTYAFSLEMRSSLSNRNIKLLLQGSYANKTNVKQESDVDIAVIEENTFKVKYPNGANDSTYNFVTSNINKANTKTLKDEVEEALKLKFGNDVERKNKSIKVHGNSYRVNADTVPAMRYKNFEVINSFDRNNYVGGITIVSDEGEIIVNYPEQHIANGRRKNVTTNYYYKKMVRVIKKIRYIMEDNNIESAKKVSSFALESLLWNIPDNIYLDNSQYRHVYLFNEIVYYIFTNINSISIYKEANGIKPLCSDLESEKNMKQFIRELHEFYEYE